MSKQTRTKIGVDSTGKHNAIARKGEPTLATHHSSMAARANDSGIAPSFMKPAAKKALPDTPIHNGMHSRQIAGAGVGGMGHATATISGGQTIATSGAAAPMQHAYGGGVPKVRNAAPIKPGMRSRIAAPARSLTDSTPHDISPCGRELLDQGKC